MRKYRIVWGHMNQNVGDYDVWGEALAAVKLLLTQGTQCTVFSDDFDYDHDGLTEEQLEQLEEIRS